jgi:hypothetical protein
MVAVMVLVPGTPGMKVKVVKATSHRTVAWTWAGVPTGREKPVVSTVTARVSQKRSRLLRMAEAPAAAAAWASPAEREMEAARAASEAAAWTASLARAMRPPRRMRAARHRAGTAMIVNSSGRVAAVAGEGPVAGHPVILSTGRAAVWVTVRV